MNNSRRVVYVFLGALSACALNFGVLYAEDGGSEVDRPRGFPASLSGLLDGAAQEVKGDFSGAVATYSNILDAEPSNIRAYLARGRVRRQIGDEAEGMQDVQQALNLIADGLQRTPNNAELYYLRGHARRILKQWDEAIRDTEKAIDMDPKRTNWPLDLKAIRAERRLHERLPQ